MSTLSSPLLALYPKLEDIPACDEGMKLAHAFLESCVKALETGGSSNFNARFQNYERHWTNCDKCNEC